MRKIIFILMLIISCTEAYCAIPSNFDLSSPITDVRNVSKCKGNVMDPFAYNVLYTLGDPGKAKSGDKVLVIEDDGANYYTLEEKASKLAINRNSKEVRDFSESVWYNPEAQVYVINKGGELYTFKTTHDILKDAYDTASKVKDDSEGIWCSRGFVKESKDTVSIDSKHNMKISQVGNSDWFNFKTTEGLFKLEVERGTVSKITYLGYAYQDMLKLLEKKIDTSSIDRSAVTLRYYNKFREEHASKNEAAAKIYGLTTTDEVDKINNGTTKEQLKAAEDLNNTLVSNGVTQSKADSITKSVETAARTIKSVKVDMLASGSVEWKQEGGDWCIVDKKGKVKNKSGWFLINDNGVHLYYLQNGKMIPSYEDDWNKGYAVWTDANGYGYINSTLINNNVSSVASFKKLQEEIIKDMASNNIDALSMAEGKAGNATTKTTAQQTAATQQTVTSNQQSNKANQSTTGPVAQQETRGPSEPQKSIMEQSDAKSIDVNGQEVKQQDNTTLTTNYDTAKIKMEYNQSYRVETQTVSGEDETYVYTFYIPETDFKIDWPQQFKIVNGNLKTQAHYIPTKDEPGVKEVIASMYANAPNGASNITDAAFSAQNREANEGYNEYLPNSLRDMFGGDFYDIDSVVDPVAIVAAQLDCLEYDASKVNWSTTDPVNGWIKNDSQEYVASNELINMMILKAFGEYQYFSCYTVDKSTGEGTVTLYITRSVQEMYTNYKRSIFNYGIATKETPITFNDALKFIYRLDEKYAPLRNEKINMQGLTDKDYKDAGVLNINDTELKEAVYYLINQGYFTADEVNDKFGSRMTEGITEYLVKKIYNVLNRNVNINTRVK